MDEITITLDPDPATLGPEADEDDIEVYRRELEQRLNALFEGTVINVELGSETSYRNEDNDDAVSTFMRDWVQTKAHEYFLDRVFSMAACGKMHD